MTALNFLKKTGLALAAMLALGAHAQQQGVSKDEIVLGTIQDLSGPLAGFGKQARLGMMLAVDEINEQGGLNGRKIKLRFIHLTDWNCALSCTTTN